jgi:NAD(P)-dependent dehydrogenase (short-subunit alcohol dehydrogenase family)
MRRIIITGANNGIGLALTRALLEMGDRVAALDLATDHLGPLQPELLATRCDVTNRDQVRDAVEQAEEAWGGVDILINNACLALFTPFSDRGPDDIRREFEVNYFGYVNMIAEVLPIMRRERVGVIHNMSSGVGFTGMPGMTGYTSTKGAIESLTRTLALELAGEGIVVNVMHPPLTRTQSASGFGVPAEMMADPEKVGRRLARKVGSHSPYITPDLTTAVGLFGNRHFPVMMGKFLSRMARRAQTEQELKAGG